MPVQNENHEEVYWERMKFWFHRAGIALAYVAIVYVTIAIHYGFLFEARTEMVIFMFIGFVLLMFIFLRYMLNIVEEKNCLQAIRETASSMEMQLVISKMVKELSKGEIEKVALSYPDLSVREKLIEFINKSRQALSTQTIFNIAEIKGTIGTVLFVDLMIEQQKHAEICGLALAKLSSSHLDYEYLELARKMRIVNPLVEAINDFQ